MSSDNNCHALFIVNAASGDDMAEDAMPIYETYQLSELGENLLPGDYEGIMSVTIVSSGDVIDTEVSYHITADHLVDVEKL